MLVSCRSMAEYRGMFTLTDGDLAGGVLDCPGGAAGFTAEARALGCAATACDPLYATATREALTADGIGTEIRRVGYEFQRGGDAMLICLR